MLLAIGFIVAVTLGVIMGMGGNEEIKNLF